MADTAPRVIGLDLSLTTTGIARSDGWTHTIGETGITKRPIRERAGEINWLARGIVQQIREGWYGGISTHPHGADLTVVELPHIGGPYGGQLERVGLFWAVLRELDGFGMPYATPTQAQRCAYALGKGSGTKGAIIEAVTRRWPAYETRGDDNVADAVVYMAMGLDYLTGESEVPDAHRKVLLKIDWPGGKTS